MGEDLRRMARKNRQISIQLELLANRALAQTGITAVQADVLLFILNHAEEGTSLTDIHQAFGYSMAAISSLLKRLREKAMCVWNIAGRMTGASFCSAQKRASRCGSFWIVPSARPRGG